MHSRQKLGVTHSAKAAMKMMIKPITVSQMTLKSMRKMRYKLLNSLMRKRKKI